jgi:hypothetical protein
MNGTMFRVSAKDKETDERTLAARLSIRAFEGLRIF